MLCRIPGIYVIHESTRHGVCQVLGLLQLLQNRPTKICSMVYLIHEMTKNMLNPMIWHQRRQWQPTPVLLPGKSHGWRSLVGCSPWGCWESDMTERLHFHFSLSCIGEGNGNPLQCSCLENPRDGGAWWAAVSGVTQSWTQLKQLSSSSSMIWHNKSTNKMLNK